MPRFDLFTPIHKALRAMIYETGGALQTADFADEQGAAACGRRVRAWSWGSCKQHHDLEEEFVFPRVRPFEEEIIDDLQAQHQEVERLLGIAGGGAGRGRTADAAVAGRRWRRPEPALQRGHGVVPGAPGRRGGDPVAGDLEALRRRRARRHPARSWGPSGPRTGCRPARMFRGLNRMELVESSAPPRRPCRRRRSTPSGSSARRTWSWWLCAYRRARQPGQPRGPLRPRSVLRDAVDAAAAVADYRARHADDLAVGDDLAQTLQRGYVVAPVPAVGTISAPLAK